MKSLNVYLAETKSKEFTRHRKLKKLKSPLDIGDNIQLVSIGLNSMGGGIANVVNTINNKKQSIRYTASGLNTMDIEFLCWMNSGKVDQIIYKNQFDFIKLKVKNITIDV